MLVAAPAGIVEFGAGVVADVGEEASVEDLKNRDCHGSACNLIYVEGPVDNVLSDLCSFNPGK